MSSVRPGRPGGDGLNDADAAGLAEERFGAAARSGVVVLLTFGTGSARR